MGKMKKIALKGKFEIKIKKRVSRNFDTTNIELWLVRKVPVDDFYRILEERLIQKINVAKGIPGLSSQTVSAQPGAYVVLALQNKRGKDVAWVQGYTYGDMRLFVPNPEELNTWKWLPKEEAKDTFVEFLAKTYGIELEIYDSIVF
jgi:hypothetical protein